MAEDANEKIKGLKEQLQLLEKEVAQEEVLIRKGQQTLIDRETSALDKDGLHIEVAPQKINAHTSTLIQDHRELTGDEKENILKKAGVSDRSVFAHSEMVKKTITNDKGESIEANVERTEYIIAQDPKESKHQHSRPMAILSEEQVKDANGRLLASSSVTMVFEKPIKVHAHYADGKQADQTITLGKDSLAIETKQTGDVTSNTFKYGKELLIRIGEKATKTPAKQTSLSPTHENDQATALHDLEKAVKDKEIPLAAAIVQTYPDLANHKFEGSNIAHIAAKAGATQTLTMLLGSHPELASEKDTEGKTVGDIVKAKNLQSQELLAALEEAEKKNAEKKTIAAIHTPGSQQAPAEPYKPVVASAEPQPQPTAPERAAPQTVMASSAPAPDKHHAATSHHHAQSNPADIRRASAILAGLDKNGDHVVSYDEFNKAVKSNPNLLNNLKDALGNNPENMAAALSQSGLNFDPNKKITKNGLAGVDMQTAVRNLGAALQNAGIKHDAGAPAHNATGGGQIVAGVGPSGSKGHTIS